MADGEADPVAFEDLLTRGLAAAQDASGAIWTDYNIHDPGVTLLEQTCFALTELALRADLPVRDLLTGPGDAFNPEQLALFGPHQVLPAAPLGREDLERALAGIDGLIGVHLEPEDGTGLYRATMVHHAAVPSHEAADRLRRAFSAIRPMCTDLEADVHCQVPVLARLNGHLLITDDAVPERVVAGVLHLGSGMIAGALDGPDRAARAGQSRDSVGNNPARYFEAPPSARPLRTGLDPAALKGVEGLLEVHDLRVEVASDGSAYRQRVLALAPPDDQSLAGLTVMRGAIDVALDPERVAGFLDLLRGHEAGQAPAHLDAADWADPRPGRHRTMPYHATSVSLPRAYRPDIAHLPPARRADRIALRQLSGYRAAIDGVLAGLSADLAAMPHLLTGKASVPRTHWPGDPNAVGESAELTGTDAWANAYRDRDDAPCRRRAVLDYLLALQGESMPAYSPPSIDLYDAAGPDAGALRRREQALRALPDGNRLRGQGWGAATGMLRRICALADLADPGTGPYTQVLGTLGLRFGAEQNPARAVFTTPDDPMQAYPPVLNDQVSEEPDALIRETPCLATGAVTQDLLAILSRPETYLIGRDGDDAWRLLARRPDGSLADCGRLEAHAEAVVRANALRGLAAGVCRSAEGGHLVEDILLREAGPFQPHLARFFLTGWTPRTRDGAYRAFVAELLRRETPAHVFIEPVWLDFDEMVLFERVHTDWQNGDVGAKALREAVNDLTGQA